MLEQSEIHSIKQRVEELEQLHSQCMREALLIQGERNGLWEVIKHIMGAEVIGGLDAIQKQSPNEIFSRANEKGRNTEGDC